MFKKNSIWVFVAAVIILPFTVYGLVNWLEKKYKPLPVYDKPEMAVFEMRNQDNQLISNKSFDGKIVIVDFFFTHCPGICPKMTNNLKSVQQVFKADDNIQFNSFSVDPERDSVARLSFYAGQFGIENKNWNLLTGNKKDIYRLARKSFMVVAADGDGGPNDFIHSDKLVLIDTKQRIRGFYDGTNPSEIKMLISDIRKLQKEAD